MTMDQMNQEFKLGGNFDKVTRRYDSITRLYEFTLTKGDNTAVYSFKYPGDVVFKKKINDIQREFIDTVIKNFDEIYGVKENKNTNYIDILDALGYGHQAKVLLVDETCVNPFRIANVIFNEPATIVFWADGTKTVVKCQEGDEFDPEKGLTMAITKKVYGNKGRYFEEIKKWTEPYYEESDTPVAIDYSGTLAGCAAHLRRTLENAYKLLVGFRDDKAVEDIDADIDEAIGSLGEALE